MDLKTYLQPMSSAQRKAFAKRVNAAPGHLANISYKCRDCSVELAIAIERESGRAVQVEEIRPDIDWKSLRTTLTRDNAA